MSLLALVRGQKKRDKTPERKPARKLTRDPVRDPRRYDLRQPASASERENEVKAAEGSNRGRSAESASQRSGSTRRPRPVPSVPAGWEAVWNEQYSEWFYVNLQTRVSQWEEPTRPAHVVESRSRDIVPYQTSPKQDSRTPREPAGGHESLLDQLQGLNITAVDRICGTDIPYQGRMAVELLGPAMTSWEVVMYEPGSSRPAFGIKIFRPYDYQRRRASSAVAMLQRGPNDPLLVAVSGWQHRPLANPEYQINCAKSEVDVQQMCFELQYPLAKDFRDRNPRKFNACHAEKQLLAHIYFECPALRNAKLHVSFSICDNCRSFFPVFERATGIKLQIIVH